LGDSLRASLRDMAFRPASFFGSKPFGLIFVCFSFHSRVSLPAASCF
jgi:hypothetical protein